MEECEAAGACLFLSQIGKDMRGFGFDVMLQGKVADLFTACVCVMRGR